MIRFNANPDLIIAEAGDADRPARIGGIAVPWDVTATVSDGTQVKFERGAFDTTAKKAKLVENHDLTQLRGTVEVSDGPDGLEFVATFANTAAARDAIELVKAGAYDSVSVGANPTKFKYDKDGVLVVSAADLVELSLVAVPAFSQAVITEIAASTPDADDAETPAIPEEETMSEDIQAEAVEAPVTATAPIWAQPKKLRLPSPGEYILAMKRGGADFAQLNANIQAATGDVLVSDAAGVIPTPIVGPIFQDIQGVRPVVSALGPKAMPESGASFIRPWVKVHSSVGEQATELTALSTADFEIDDLVISKKTFGGKLVLSEQVIDWSAPSMLDAAISDMAIKYALATEKETIDTIAAAVTNTQEVINTTATSASEFISDLYTAAAGIAGTGNFLPNVLVVSPAKWAVLGSLVDGQNRPLFPQAAPMNSAGTMNGVVGFNGNPLGLQLVVSNQVGSQAVGNKTATEYYWLMNSRGVEVYEQYKGFLRDESPANLSVTVATRGYFAAKVIDVNMIRIIGPDATF